MSAIVRSFGDDAAGYSVSMDSHGAIVNVRAWGFWGTDLASTFGQNVAGVCRSASPGASLQMDMIDLKPMRDEGQHSFGALVSQLAGLNIATTIVTGSHLTRLQLIRLATKHGRKDAIRFIQRELREGSTP